MRIPKSFYSFITEPGSQKIRYVNCDLCRKRVFDFTIGSAATPGAYDKALATHFRGEHGAFIKALSLQGLVVPESWVRRVFMHDQYEAGQEHELRWLIKLLGGDPDGSIEELQGRVLAAIARLNGGPKTGVEMTAEELKAMVDPVVEALKKKLGDRGAVIVMAGAPHQGSHDAYYVNWGGPCLMAKGLREQGNEKLQELIKFSEKV